MAVGGRRQLWFGFLTTLFRVATFSENGFPAKRRSLSVVRDASIPLVGSQGLKLLSGSVIAFSFADRIGCSDAASIVRTRRLSEDE